MRHERVPEEGDVCGRKLWTDVGEPDGPIRAAEPAMDRTRHARRGLMPIAEWAGSKFKSGIRHSVSYGIYLENRIFSRKGRLSILKPTLDKLAPEIYRGLSKILDR